MTRTFPPGFLWGVTTGAHQTEGNNLASDWWASENAPGATVKEPSGDADDSYHRWREDMDLVAGAGFTDYRLGIEWSRVEPADGRISHAVVAHYRRMVEGAVERVLRPLPTLHHFTHPLWFTLGGGWSRPDAVERFLRYVDALAPVLEAGVERVGVQAYTRGRITVAGGEPVPVFDPAATTRAAAEAAGCEYVAASAASASHHAWSATPWTRRFHLSLRGGAPYHPDAAGMAAVAELVRGTLTGPPSQPAD